MEICVNQTIELEIIQYESSMSSNTNLAYFRIAFSLKRFTLQSRIEDHAPLLFFRLFFHHTWIF